MDLTEYENRIMKGDKKAIHKKLLGLIVAYEAQEFELGSKICSDNSFNVAFVDTADIDMMKAYFIKKDMGIPIHNSYCGHAISKIVSSLPYGKELDLSSVIRVDEFYSKVFSDE
ncbi:hypothetical protein K9M18_06350 [Candidatus Woesearchaeota archaeon]|nr:hypothetical protein [Candidatus Woesearchaeota archaeon]MCF8013846.1 hypothetical protein [Candidatus Woesearchaeota archaeon]